MTRRLASLMLFLLAGAAIAGGVWWYSLTEALARLEDRGRADLSLAADRLTGELQQYRELAVLLADHPTLAALLRGEVSTEEAGRLLLRTADKMGTLNIHVSNANGRVLASSDRNGEGVASDRREKPSFRRAMQGSLGAHHEHVEGLGGRAYIFAAPVFAGGRTPAGVVSVDVDMWAVESAWVGDPQTIFFADELGVVFVSNRSELLFRFRGDVPPPGNMLDRFGYTVGLIQPFLPVAESRMAELEIWEIEGGPYLPNRALHLTQPLPVIGLTGEILLDIAPAQRLALLQMAVFAAIYLGLGAILFALLERRRALANRLALEAATNLELEKRVVERTRELSQANDRLTQAQQDLVQAGKLSALGQMSAGISHELNQPLMAIRSYAENAELLLARDQPGSVTDNLSRISELARRMGRIIKNLRAFARQENEPVVDVDLAVVVDAALELSQIKIDTTDVSVSWHRPAHPVMVRGGEVRLQQVVMNLISNACDAMAGEPERQITIKVVDGIEKAQLILRDTGPGIAEPERIFDPFYSTKEVGHSEGMGLGLSISYGLVQSFGGAIRGRNRDVGGAEFTVELARARSRAAA